MTDAWTASDAWSKLPICGCGAPDEALDFLHWLLWSQTSWSDLSDTDWHEGCDGGNRMAFIVWGEEQLGGAFWLALYTLAHLGFTEHGGGVRFGWLLPDGERARRFLDEHGTDPDEWPTDEVPA